MDTDLKLKLPKEEIAAFCERWNVTEFAVFGSVLRDDFRSDSDVDVMVTFPSVEATPTLLEHVRMQDELAEILGRPVDLLTRRGVEHSKNPIRRRSVLQSARIVHAAA